MKKVVTILLSIILLLAFAACSENPGDSDSSVAGKFEVVFIDIENSSDTTVHYDGAKNDRSLGYRGVKPADCYLIKTGNIEILVDAGFQLSGSGEVFNQRISKIYQENVLKKIEKYCTDGVLEYLIVTHGDFDHIAGAAVDGGVFDYFNESDNKRIENIIDFDSDLVVYLSNPNGNDIFPSGQNRLLKTEIIDKYRTKRDLLVKTKKTKHIPAAAFFKGTDYLQENTLVNAMPEEYLKKYFRLDKGKEVTDQIDLSNLINFYYFSDDEIIHNIYDDTTKNQKANNLKFDSTYEKSDIELGQIKKENDRYYYSIDLNGVELRILYNWYYDHFYRHSFDSDKEFNSQDRNNISVCLEVVSGTSKFLTFGDLGSGETGLINYYKDTSILKNVTCFKASHHGSTTNGENSSDLFELMTPKMVIVPGVAQINQDILQKNNMTNDSIFSGLSRTAIMKKEFFEHIFSGNPDTKIYCMQVAQLLKEEESGTKFALISASFYGDVFLNCNDTGCKIDSSYKGNVEGYVSGTSDKSKHLIFSNNLDSNILSYCETEHYKAIYENNGKI